MTNPLALLSHLRRPRILVRAAREGVKVYDRDMHLAPLAPTADAAQDPIGTIHRLRSLEAECETARRAHAAGYSPGRHVALLVALLAEVHMLAGPAAFGG